MSAQNPDRVPTAGPGPEPAAGAVRLGRLATALGLDVVCVLTFALGGMNAHGEATTAGGVAHVAWPFLAGLVAGWLLARAWIRPFVVWPTGAVVCAATWAVGHVVRAATGGGEAVGFLAVSAVFLALTMLGWRLIAGAVVRARSHR